MKATVFLLTALVGLLLVPPTSAVELSPHAVELRLTDVYVTQPLAGTATFRWADENETVGWSATPTAPLDLRVLFVNQTNDSAPFAVQLDDSAGTSILRLVGNSTGGDITLSESVVDPRIELNDSENSLKIISGGVVGTLNVAVEYRNPAQAATHKAHLLVDPAATNDSPAAVSTRLDGRIAFITYALAEAPPSMPFNVVVTNGTREIYNVTGTMDWFVGTFHLDAPGIDDGDATKALVSIDIDPTRVSGGTSVSLRNDVITKRARSAVIEEAKPPVGYKIRIGAPIEVPEESAPANLTPDATQASSEEGPTAREPEVAATSTGSTPGWFANPVALWVLASVLLLGIIATVAFVATKRTNASRRLADLEDEVLGR